ncbi:hypothetical protein V6N13_143282 [Hibiscus sabdariffa]|uniref:Uncharacterized protein n=1 Tax=Hibiscus sabdariffa TaxID=183260 RepID=A0ABR2FGT7_9ROSI
MLVSFLCCITAREVEVRRLKLINEYGIIDYQEDQWIPMNIMWLTPQFLLLGTMGGLVEGGMEGSFYNLVPESMRLYRTRCHSIMMVMGKILSIGTTFVFGGWFGDISATSHLDRYYMMLAITSIGSMAFFTVACYWNYMAPEECLAQGTEPLAQESSSQSLLKGYFFSQGNSVAARPSRWNSVRESLRNRSFGSRSHGNSRSFSK